MEYCFCWQQYGVVTFITFLTIAGQLDGRDLRPSDHGLVYEDSPSPANNGESIQEMLSFFGATTSSEPLPEAKNLTADPITTWWRTHGGGRSHDLHRDHVTTVLLVTSLFCGVIGVVLLVVSGILFLYRLRKQKRERFLATSLPISEPNS
ncbi:hypothetical protein Adt_09452 [Abeliophyllum distichum]|uniref:Uncharacterized protein n=1 Tax=Abeliophyllum distichum TaxID=126358 RepID=A0ABD1UH80_9LAMI